MQTDLPPLGRPTNRYAVISLVSAILTFLSFCIAVVPIPGTGWVCYPASLLFGLLAVLTGFTALRQIRQTGEGGRRLAWAALAILVLTLAAFLLAVVVLFEALRAFLQSLQQSGGGIPH